MNDTGRRLPRRFPVEVEKRLRRRIVLISTVLEPSSTTLTIAQILFLGMESVQKPIRVLIDSPGGYVYDGFAIHDTIEQSKAPIHTHCIEEAHGLAALLVAAGARGHRSCSPEASFQLVPMAGEGVEKAQLALVNRLAAACGREAAQVQEDLVAGLRLGAKEAIAYGIVDRITDNDPALLTLVQR